MCHQSCQTCRSCRSAVTSGTRSIWALIYFKHEVFVGYKHLSLQCEHSIQTFNANIQCEHSIQTFHWCEHSIPTFNANIQSKHSTDANIQCEHSIQTFNANIQSNPPLPPQKRKNPVPTAPPPTHNSNHQNPNKTDSTGADVPKKIRSIAN